MNAVPICRKCVHGIEHGLLGMRCWRGGEISVDPVYGGQTKIMSHAGDERRDDGTSFWRRTPTKCGPSGRFYRPKADLDGRGGAA